MKRKFSTKRFLALAMTFGVVATTLFPNGAYAAEVGEQVAESSENLDQLLDENKEFTEQTIIEAKEDEPVKQEDLKESEKDSKETVESTTDVPEDEAAEEEPEEVEPEESTTDVEMTTSLDEFSDKAVEIAMPHTRLIVLGDVTDFKNATSVVAYDGCFVLSYDDAVSCESDYSAYVSEGIAVEYDELITEDEEKVSTNARVEADANDTSANVEEEGKETKKSVVVAVIDTGLNVSEDMKDDVLEGYSVLSDDNKNITDESGHGTIVTKALLSQLEGETEDVKVLPIQALDSNAKGTVLSVYTAIKYAISKDVDVINLSLAGLGQSNMLTNAINDAYNHGISVVCAAGNYADDAVKYMPGNIDAAISVSAVSEDKTFAPYSNHGASIDFSALGTYKYEIKNGEKTEEAVVEGTSVSCAYVSAYVALIKAINAQFSETDVKAKLQNACEDLGTVGFDEYFGNGYLCKENISEDAEEIEPSDDEKLGTELEETEEDAKQELEGQYSCNGANCTHNMSTFTAEANMTYDTCHIGTYFTATGVNDATYTLTKAQMLSGAYGSGWKRYIVCDNEYTVETQAHKNYGKKTKYSANSAAALKDILASNEAAVIYLGCDVGIDDTMIVNGIKYLNCNGHTIRMNMARGWTYANGAWQDPPSALACKGANFSHLKLINARIMGEADETSSGYSKAYTGIDVQKGLAEIINCSIGHCGNAITSNAGSETRVYGGELFSNKANGISNYGICEVYGVACYNNVINNALTASGNAYNYNDLDIPISHTNAGISTHAGLKVGSWVDNHGITRNCIFANNGKHGIVVGRDVPSGSVIDIQNGSFYGNGNCGISFTERTDVVYIPCTINNIDSYGNAKYGIFYSWKYNNGGLIINGGIYRNNGSHGIVLDSGTMQITNAWSGAYHNGYGWVDAGNGHSGVCVRSGTAYIDGGVYFYNNVGIECQGGTTHLRATGLGTYVSLNDKYGFLSKNGGNVIVYSNAALDSHANGNCSVRVENGSYATIAGGNFYSNTYGIYNNGGVTILAGGTVFNNKAYGVFNKAGTFTLAGGTISGNKSGLYNLGSATITGATIQSNENGVKNEKSGTTTIDGTAVTIQNNSYGVLNTAEYNGVTIGSASIKNNTKADLGQSGETMKISGRNTNTNTIELGVGSDGKPEIVTIDGVTAEKKLVYFKQSGEGFTAQMAKDNITIERPMFHCVNTTPSAVLAKLEFKDSAQKTLVNGTKRQAVMRPGNGKNGADKTHIVLSTKYAATYKVKDEIDGFEFSVPDEVALFWKEDVNIDSLPKLMATVGGALLEFPILGWLKDGIGKVYEIGTSMLFDSDETQKDHEIVAQMGLCNLYIDGNGQTDGENYVIEEFNCATDTLPENTFEKHFMDDWYYKELGEQKQHETKYSYQGWSLSNDANYLSEGVMKPQGTLDFADVVVYMESHKDSLTYGDNGLPNIPLYVVWDEYPELSTKSIGMISNWVDEKTDAELFQILYENVKGEDTEDGALTNGKEEKGVICTDFDKDEIRQLKHTGMVTVTFKATDGVGNVTERKIRLYVNSANPIEGVYINRARCINRMYYDAGKGYNTLDKEDAHYLDGYKKGGLMPNDLWYTDPEYADVITESFDNLENNSPEITWYFTHEQVLETQDWIDEHGFGNSEEKDALKEYYEKYKATYKKLK